MNSQKRATAVRFERPTGITPAMAGVLTQTRLPSRLISAMLLDLQSRGWLTSEPEKDQWALVSARHLPDSATLTSAETLLLNTLFSPGLATQEGRDYGVQYVSALTCRKRLGGHVDEILDALGDDLVAATLCEKNPLKKGRFGSQPKLSLTSQGNVARDEARGFRSYLERAEIGSLSVDEAAGLIQQNLPYTIAFDIAGHWHEQLESPSSGSFSGAGQLVSLLEQQPLAVGAFMGTSGADVMESVFVVGLAQNLRTGGRARR